MSWALDPPVYAGGVACVPITKTDVSVTGSKRHLAVHCEKRPVMFLVINGDAVNGLDVSGRRRSVEEIERLYPSAIEQAQVRLARNAD